MTDMYWRFALASVIGTSHLATNTSCQDACDCRVLRIDANDSVLVVVGSDGAGTAIRAEEGSNLLCTHLIHVVAEFLTEGRTVADVSREVAKSWLSAFYDRVVCLAENDGVKPRDFACTALAAIVGHDGAVFLQVGDGAIVFALHAEPDEYGWVFWPHKGEYANETYFATDPRAVEEFEYELVDKAIDELALFTDGVERLALHFPTRTAYAPFFRPMFAPIRLEPEGHSERLSSSLAAFLSSSTVVDRTDDDKSLVLATRRKLDIVEDCGAHSDGQDDADILQ